MIDKLKEQFAKIKIQGIDMYKDMCLMLEEYSYICKKENELAEVSSWDFVRAFEHTAKQISEKQNKLYIDIIDKAIYMLARGDEQANVLIYFDKLLYEYNGDRLRELKELGE